MYHSNECYQEKPGWNWDKPVHWLINIQTKHIKYGPSIYTNLISQNNFNNCESMEGYIYSLPHTEISEDKLCTLLALNKMSVLYMLQIKFPHTLFLKFHLFINFTSRSQFPLPPLLPFLFPLLSTAPPPIHFFSVSVQRGAGFPWVSTNHSISTCNKSKHLSL